MSAAPPAIPAPTFHPGPQARKPTPPPSYQELVLGDSKYIGEKAKEIVNLYVKDPKISKLDGSIHPALDTSYLPKDEINTDHKWMDDGQEDGEDEVDLEQYYRDVEGEEQNFLNSMKEFSETAKSKYVSQIDPNATHSMDQVWEIINAAIQKFKVEDEKGFWGSLRKAFRKLGEHEKAITGWLGLLPTQSNYMSVISGGLKLILEAAAHLHRLREDIFEAIAEIPIILNSTQRVLAIYKEAKRLRDYSSALYVSILHTLTHILKYLQHKIGPKALKATFKQSSFESGMIEKLKTMKTCREHFNREATMCAEELARKSHDIEKSTNCVAKRTFQEVRDVNQLVLVSREEQRRTRNEIMERIGENDKADRKERAENRRVLEELRSAMMEIKDLFLASPQVHDTTLSLIQLSRHPGLSRSPSPFRKEDRGPELSRKEARRILLSRLKYDKAAIRDDVPVNVGLGRRLPLEEQDRAVHIMKSPVLAAWLNSLHSSLLVINGNSRQNKPLSSVSFASAKLSDALDRTESTSRVLVLYFFCAGKGGDVCEIVNSLLAQLLKQCSKCVGSLAPIAELGGFDSGDTPAVCKRFEVLLRQLEDRTMVFCIIDRLSHYLDNETKGKEANELVRWLLKLTRRKKHGYILKLLLTSSNRLHAQALEDRNLQAGGVLEVQKRIPRGGGFTDMKWDTGVGQLI